MEGGKEMRMHMIPLNSVRKIMGRHCPYHISTEAIVELRDILEGLGLEIAQQAVAEFENLNKYKEKQGLRPLKRLNAWAVKNSDLYINIINGLKNKNKGLQPEEIVIPQGGNMSADNSTKPDKTTDDRREVV